MDKDDLRIRELASVTVLDRSRLLAGRDGLDRPVARVVVRDVGPGNRLQVRDGDLVVARRAGIPGGGEGRELVARLATGGAAALAFVDGHYLPGALAGVRHAADEAGLPLFALPRGVDAAAAAAALAAAIDGGGAAAAAGAVRAGASLARAARDGGTPAIVTALAAATGLAAVLHDDAGRRLAASGRVDGRRLAVRRVPGGELVLHGNEGGVLAEPLLEQAAALVALETSRGDPAAAARDRREADDVRRALESGVPWAEPVVVVVVAAAGAEPALAGRLRDELGATCGRAAEDLVALLPGAPEMGAVAALTGAEGWGASSSCDDVARGLREARAARALGPVLGRAPTYDQVRVHDALLRALGPDGLADVASGVLGGLEPELVATLAAYLLGGLSVAAAAEQLFVHKNTVRYRLRQVERLSGRRLDDLAGRLELETAILGTSLETDPGKLVRKSP